MGFVGLSACGGRPASGGTGTFIGGHPLQKGPGQCDDYSQESGQPDPEIRADAEGKAQFKVYLGQVFGLGVHVSSYFLGDLSARARCQADGKIDKGVFWTVGMGWGRRGRRDKNQMGD